MYSPKKSMIGFTRNQLNRSPIKSFHKMKSSTPINEKTYK